MRQARIASWLLLTILTGGLPAASLAAEGQRGEAQRAAERAGRDHPATTTEQREEARSRQPLPVRDLLYNRPSGAGAPVGILVANVPRGAHDCLPGGSAGTENESLTLAVLAPVDHVGLTIHDQPSLYWYLSDPVTCPIIFTVIDDHTVQPLLEVTLSPPTSPGVQRVQLTDYHLQLLPGVSYKWSVALVPDPEDRAKDLIAITAIRRIEPADTLRAQLAQADTAAVPALYAEAGLWYDALAALSDLIETAPDDPGLRHQRASLLEQGGLREIATAAGAPDLTREP